MKLIDKDVLVVEIGELKSELYPNFYEYDYDAAKVELLEKLENFINTLEVKEVDLEKEIDLVEDKYYGFESLSRVDIIDIAKYFFELGIKVKQG